MTEGHQYIGATIAGKYRLHRLIGVGGMGSVYEGQHVDLAKKVAVKIIDSAADASQELATRFKREARAASAVESENIVQVFDVGRDPQVGLYMVMELLQGEDLEMRLRKQPGRRLDPVLVAQLGHQVARALVKAHAARVIHRDLKPANIFLTEREDGTLRVKILDFGISKLLASNEASIATSKNGLMDLTAAGVALGTPQYMSPEQAQGLTTVDHRTDVWGLGVVLYEALAGIPAYAELSSYQETILKILAERPQPLSRVAPWVPQSLADVVHAAIEHDVTKRIQDCTAMAVRIEEAMPQALMVSTGPFVSAKGRMSSPSYSSFDPPSAALQPAASPKPLRRPITLGDDTQVVVRPSDPSSLGGEDASSMTMLADSARQTSRDPPKVVVANPLPAPSSVDDEQGAQSTGDPTMFQTPAWVEPPAGGPTTMKSGLALGEAPTTPPKSKPMNVVVTGALTALAVVVIGGGLLALTGRDGPAESPATGATVETAAAPGNGAAPVAADPPLETAAAEPSVSPAAPPATGTGAVPMTPPPPLPAQAAPSVLVAASASAAGASALANAPKVTPTVDAAAAATVAVDAHP